MPNSIKPTATTQPQNRTYNAWDMQFTHTLAAEQMEWISTILDSIILNREHGRIHAADTLHKLAAYLCECFWNDHEKDAERYGDNHSPEHSSEGQS